MLPLVITLIRTVAASALATAVIAWSGRFVARLVARQLQVPETLVHDTGRYVYAQVYLFERALLSGLFGKS
jgi:hypothetical protein